MNSPPPFLGDGAGDGSVGQELVICGVGGCQDSQI